jgi:spermidine synthase
VRARFEELDWSETRMGVISLRRRIEPSLQVDVYEVKLGDEFLMSSLFTVAEVELARLGLAQAVDADLDVVVGGLGLGYTAQTALAARVRSLIVVEALGEVIGWQQRALRMGTR